MGFELATVPGGPRAAWDESTYYRFTSAQVEREIVAAAKELQDMCLVALDTVFNDEYWLARLRFPQPYRDYVRQSWQQDQCGLLGRLDLIYDGTAPPKLWGYQAETPAGLFESSLVQQVWLAEANRDLFAGEATQYNTIHADLVRTIGFCVPSRNLFHLAGNTKLPEDSNLLKYLFCCSEQAGLLPRVLDMQMIGHKVEGQLCDAEGLAIQHLYKYYPWEWMFAEDMSGTLRISRTTFFEPVWKSLLGHGGLLALLWTLFPRHPNLLPAFFADDPRANAMRRPVRRGFFRTSVNARITNPEMAIWRVRELREDSAHVVIEPSLLANEDGLISVLGLWVIGDELSGMMVREENLQSGINIRWIPHAVLG